MILFLAFVFLSSLFQGDTGQLGGTVMDAKGAVIVGASVRLTSRSTSQVPKKGFAKNWQVNGIVILQTGTPFSIVDSPNFFIMQRANFATAAGTPSTPGKVESFFDTAAFVPSRPLLGGANLGTPNNPGFDPDHPFGNTPRNLFYGPGQKNLDLSVVKFVPLSEKVRGELRAEFFNLFNWTNFANPNSNIAVPATFGRITATSAGPRVIQFALKVSF
jgi:hypothetical protein